MDIREWLSYGFALITNSNELVVINNWNLMWKVVDARCLLLYQRSMIKDVPSILLDCLVWQDNIIWYDE